MSRKLYIVNFIDRPCERMIAQEINGKLYYTHPDLRNDERYWGMDISERATPLEDFGIAVVWQNDRTFTINKTCPSKAVYASGGSRRIREWQGVNCYTICLGPPIPAEGGSSQPKPLTDSEVHSTAIALLKEVVDAHADDQNPDYNNCDEDPCRWCQEAIEVIDHLSK